MSKNPSQFGTRLRELREAVGLSQEELAVRAGLTAQAVSALERGHRRRPYPHTIRALAAALGDDESNLDLLLAAAHPPAHVALVQRDRAPSPASDALPTGTVTFLMTDVEGSTRLWEANPDGMREALVRHDVLVETIVGQCSGCVVRPRGEGDGRFAVFARSSDALAAAAAIQLAMYQERWQLAEPLRVRIALHTGEADLRDGDSTAPSYITVRDCEVSVMAAKS
jgi:class 3 adenylate cyclase